MKIQITILLTAFITLSAFQTKKEPEGKKIMKHIASVATGQMATKGFLAQVSLFKEVR